MTKQNQFQYSVPPPPSPLCDYVIHGCTLSRNSVVSEIFHLLPNECPTAQMAEIMFQNVVYRATVYRTGSKLGNFAWSLLQKST